MNNTTQRIISALILIGIVLLAISMGSHGMKVMLFLAGLFVIDEIHFNFVKQSRKHISYFTSCLTFSAAYIYFNFLDVYQPYLANFTHIGLVLNFALMVFLFLDKMQGGFAVSFLKKYTFLVGVGVLIPLMSIGWILNQYDWKEFSLLLILMNFSVDSGAWFFGKMFGKKKLWPSISPKKTINGSIGGVLTALILSLVFMSFTNLKINLINVLCILLISCAAQMGDLIQSKLKRQFKIKDSSGLIPGHGGMYDRLDSLLFVAPFFASWLLLIK